MKKLIIIVLLALVILSSLFLTGCSRENSKSTGGSPENKDSGLGDVFEPSDDVTPPPVPPGG